MPTPARRGSSSARSSAAGGRPRSQQSRDAIVRATMQILERKGLDGLTIEGVAARAGVGKATIYRWWPSRIALVLEALEQLPELDAPDLGSFAADLRALLENFRTLLESTPLGGVLAHLGGSDNRREPEVQRYMERRTAGGLAVIARSVERGDLPPHTDVNAVLSLALGPVLNRVFYGPRPDDAFLDLVVATITAGLPVAYDQPARGRPPRAPRGAARGARRVTRR